MESTFGDQIVLRVVESALLSQRFNRRVRMVQIRSCSKRQAIVERWTEATRR